MNIAVKYLNHIIYWSIILIPFSIAIASSPFNVFMGLLLVGFLLKKVLTKTKLFSGTALNKALLLLFIITCLSVLHTVDFKDSIKGGVLRLAHYIFILLIMVEEIKDKKQVTRIIISIILGIILTVSNEIWQVSTGNDFIRGYASTVNIGLVRATAAFKDANTLGIYLSAISPLVFGLTLYYYRNKAKIMMFFVSIIALLGTILTYSRPTLLAIYIALLFLCAVRKDKIIVALLIIFALLSPFIMPKAVLQWAKDVEYNPLRFMCNDDRIAVYRNSINMLAAHPFIGLGANTYMKNYKKYKEFPEYRNVVTLDYMYAHNMYLQMAVEIGLIGLAAFFWLIYKLFAQCRVIYHNMKDEYLKIVSLSLLACLLAFLVNGLTESSLYYSRVAVIFWYLAGLSLALNKFTNANQA